MGGGHGQQQQMRRQRRWRQRRSRRWRQRLWRRRCTRAGAASAGVRGVAAFGGQRRARPFAHARLPGHVAAALGVLHRLVAQLVPDRPPAPLGVVRRHVPPPAADGLPLPRARLLGRRRRRARCDARTHALHARQARGGRRRHRRQRLRRVAVPPHPSRVERPWLAIKVDGHLRALPRLAIATGSLSLPRLVACLGPPKSKVANIQSRHARSAMRARHACTQVPADPLARDALLGRAAGEARAHDARGARRSADAVPHHRRDFRRRWRCVRGASAFAGGSAGQGAPQDEAKEGRPAWARRPRQGRQRHRRRHHRRRHRRHLRRRHRAITRGHLVQSGEAARGHR